MKNFSLLLFIAICVAVVQKIGQAVTTVAHDSLDQPPQHAILLTKPSFLNDDGQLLCEIALQLSLESSLPHLVKQSHSKLLLRLQFCYHIRQHVPHDCDLPGCAQWVAKNVGLPVDQAR